MQPICAGTGQVTDRNPELRRNIHYQAEYSNDYPPQALSQPTKHGLHDLIARLSKAIHPASQHLREGDEDGAEEGAEPIPDVF